MSHLILIDANAFMYRAFHTTSPDVRRADGTPVGGINAFCSMIWRLLGNFTSATHMVVIGDKGGAPTFRHKIDPLYKANRSPQKPELKAQLAMIDGAVLAFGLPYVARAGVEADDIIATYSHHWTMASKGNLVTIVSSDKDLMQLIDDDQLIMFDPRHETYIRSAQVKQKFGVRPDQMVDYLALVGDSSDNVPGMPSVGEKTAAALLAAHDTIDGIYENLDKLSERQQRLFLEHEVQLIVSKQLVTLHRDVSGLPSAGGFAFVRDRDYSDLAAYCRSNEMESLARRVELDWHQ